MLFNSYEFIFAFLPVVFIVYFFLNKKRLLIASKAWLVASSLFFYCWWNIAYLPLILASMIFNYAVGSSLGKDNLKFNKKLGLSIGISFNVGLLGYFKYSDFFITNVNEIFTTNLALLQLALPLAISFFTFQQIAYLVDAYRNETKEYDFLNYALFVTFFPQLIAGPIVHHKEMMPQFKQLRNKVVNYRNISLGLFIFSIGLFKKVAIADSFAVWANKGFDEAVSLSFIEGWITSLSYTFQLYFDFSGYTDMAIGAALLFNITLPMNFNSPYKALDIQEFWRRWHITLSRFLTQYIYIPLGGNRKGKSRTYINILIIFLISGFWHGAGWTFVFWGLLHGLATVINRFWRSLGFRLNKIVAWFLTFNFVNITWVFFRATTWEDAIKVLKGMIGVNGIVLPVIIEEQLYFLTNYGITFNTFLIESNRELLNAFILFCIFSYIAFRLKNSQELTLNIKFGFKTMLVTSIFFVYSFLNFHKISEFLYFNF
ncbi:MBOAT family O-acyltransferase [Bacillus pinisoli]|uniref:MBOAT family O-acyltransferase n=1 Tax=Bacillus pinisoli TaxID=2901866 RepID=UPI001FF64CF9|nr:MBOAT family O-acyltransferase [Bacillus pinisoli]